MCYIWRRSTVLVISVLLTLQVQSLYIDGAYVSNKQAHKIALNHMEQWRGRDQPCLRRVDLLCMTYALADIASEGEVKKSLSTFMDRISVELTERHRSGPSRELSSLVATKWDEERTPLVMKKQALQELLGARRTSEAAYLFRKGFLLCHALRLSKLGMSAVSCKILVQKLEQMQALNL
jgi:hypothetical protein